MGSASGKYHMNRDTENIREKSILWIIISVCLLVLAFILVSGCCTTLLEKKELVVFKINSTGVQESGLMVNIEKPYEKHSQITQTCDGGLITFDEYRRDRLPSDQSRDNYTYTSFSWNRVNKIDATGHLEWAMNISTSQFSPNLRSIREHSDRFVFRDLENNTFTINKSKIQNPKIPSCQNLIFPQEARSKIDETGLFILQNNAGSSEGSLWKFSDSYLYVEDISSREWMRRVAPLSGVPPFDIPRALMYQTGDDKNDNYVLGVRIFNAAGTLQESREIRRVPESPSERFGYCDALGRSIDSVYSTPDGGYLIVGTLYCYN